MEEEQLILSENPVNPVNPVKKWFEYLKVQRNLCILHVSSTEAQSFKTIIFFSVSLCLCVKKI
jgi:hypothetical protein